MTTETEHEPEARPRIGQTVRVWGRQVHFHQVGSGRAVILLHGNASLGEEILRSVRQHPGIAWIAPDRPGYGLSDALPPDRYSPAVMADWTAAVASTLGIERMVLVAHSLAGGAALCFAARYPKRLDGLVLVAPFCRPTPHRWMLGLRAAVLPVLGPIIRYAVLPLALPVMRQRILRAIASPNKVPASLADLPVSHAAQPKAVVTTAAELRQFNAGMRQSFLGRRLTVPVVAIFGEDDQTSVPDWHLPWLRRHVANLDDHVLPRVGHALHHVRPGLVVGAVERVIAAAGHRPKAGR
jgi:pimeloyl-ACP methyl ester carboxylesterase